MLAVSVTGEVSVAVCQPEADSEANVAVPSGEPVADQRRPTCEPVSAASLKKRMPVRRIVLVTRILVPSS